MYVHICALQKTHVTLERECRWTRRALLVSLEVVCTCLAHRQGGEYSVRHARVRPYLACIMGWLFRVHYIHTSIYVSVRVYRPKYGSSVTPYYSIHVLEQVLTSSIPTSCLVPRPLPLITWKRVFCLFLGPRSQNRDIQTDRRTANQCHLHP